MDIYFGWAIWAPKTLLQFQLLSYLNISISTVSIVLFNNGIISAPLLYSMVSHEVIVVGGFLSVLGSSHECVNEIIPWVSSGGSVDYVDFIMFLCWYASWTFSRNYWLPRVISQGTLACVDARLYEVCLPVYYAHSHFY
jgi:hypothetical protein